MALAFLLGIPGLSASSEAEPEIRDHAGDAKASSDILAVRIEGETRDSFGLSFQLGGAPAASTCPETSEGAPCAPKVVHYQARFSYRLEGVKRDLFVEARLLPDGTFRYEAGRVQRAEEPDGRGVGSFEATQGALPGGVDAGRGVLTITVPKGLLGPAVPAESELEAFRVLVFSKDATSRTMLLDRAPDAGTGTAYRFRTPFGMDPWVLRAHPTADSPTLYLHADDGARFGGWLNADVADPRASARSQQGVAEPAGASGTCVFVGGSGCSPAARFDLTPTLLAPLRLTPQAAIKIRIDAEAAYQANPPTDAGRVRAEILADGQPLGAAVGPFPSAGRHALVLEIVPEDPQAVTKELTLDVTFHPPEPGAATPSYRLHLAGASYVTVPIAHPTARQVQDGMMPGPLQGPGPDDLTVLSQWTAGTPGASLARTSVGAERTIDPMAGMVAIPMLLGSFVLAAMFGGVLVVREERREQRAAARNARVSGGALRARRRP